MDTQSSGRNEVAKLAVLCGIVQPKSILCSFFQMNWHLVLCCPFISLFTLLNVRRAGITLVHARAGGVWLVQESYTWEAWQRVRFVHTATCSQNVSMPWKCRQDHQIQRHSSCSRGWFILLTSVMSCVVRDSCALCVWSNGKPRMIGKNSLYFSWCLIWYSLAHIVTQDTPVRASTAAELASHVQRFYLKTTGKSNSWFN